MRCSTPATVDEFCRTADGADVAIGVVERTLLLRRLPQTRRTWLKFRGGAYTGANLFALRSPEVAAGDRAVALGRAGPQESVADPVAARPGGAARRRAPAASASTRSWRALGARLGLALRAVRLNNPLAGVDVDKPEDHALAEAILEGEA